MYRLAKATNTMFVITATAVTFFAAHVASAQTAPLASWTGIYVGAYAGGAFGDTSMHLVPGPGELALAPGATTSANISPQGFVGGGLIGYNLQLPSSIVLGGEFDVGGDTASDTGTTVTAPGFPATNKVSEPWDLRARARAGWADGQFLPFLAAGLSVTRANLDLVFPCSGVTYTDSVSKTLVGFNVGAGVDYAISQNVIARLEYIFDDFGSPQFATAKPDWNDRSFSSFNNNTVRLAIAYHF